MLAWQALATAAQNDPELRRQLTQSYAEFLTVIETVLARAHPHAAADRVRAAAHGVTACIQTIDALAPMSPPAPWRTDLKAAALTLAACLGDRT
jgi:hypothetical protein